MSKLADVKSNTGDAKLTLALALAHNEVTEDKQDKPEPESKVEETKVEETPPVNEESPKTEEPKLRPAQAIKKRFAELVNQGLITDKVIKVLTDKEGTAQAFKVRYAFLLPYDSTKTIKELAYINGSPRYYSKPIMLKNKEYLMCNDIYAKTVEKFMAWADSLSK